MMGITFACEIAINFQFGIAMLHLAMHSCLSIFALVTSSRLGLHSMNIAINHCAFQKQSSRGILVGRLRRLKISRLYSILPLLTLLRRGLESSN